jgi:hypothetical protein
MKVQKMRVLASYLLGIYIPTAQACPSTQNNKSLLLLLFSIPLQHEPSYLSDATEIQDIVEVLNYRVLLLSSSSISPKSSPPTPNYSLLSYLTYLLTICSIFYTSFYPLHCPPKIVSPSSDF